MRGLDFTPSTVTPLLIATVAMLTTMGRLISAVNDRRYLKRAVEAGRVRLAIIGISQRMVRSGIRREGVRLMQHLIIISIVCFSFFSPLMRSDVRFVVMRNWMTASISILFMLNSVADYIAQRRAVRFYHPEARQLAPSREVSR